MPTTARHRSASDAPPKADVRAAPGHVRRDRDRPNRAGARDDAGFLGVVLRVQHLHTRTPALRSRSASASDSVTVDVPTSTGRPTACARVMSRTMARSFASRWVKTRSSRSIAHHGTVGGNDRRRRARTICCSSAAEALRGAGHAAQARIAAQEVLQRDRARGCVRPAGVRAPPWPRAPPAARRASDDPRRRGR